jgi:predicted HTH transcriptional regulator
MQHALDFGPTYKTQRQREEYSTHIPCARSTDPITSHKAAASVKDISRKQKILLETLRSHGPMTDEEIYARLIPGFMSASGARTRRKELVTAGLVIDAGYTRPNATGRDCRVWRVA